MGCNQSFLDSWYGATRRLFPRQFSGKTTPPITVTISSPLAFSARSSHGRLNSRLCCMTHFRKNLACYWRQFLAIHFIKWEALAVFLEGSMVRLVDNLALWSLLQQTERVMGLLLASLAQRHSDNVPWCAMVWENHQHQWILHSSIIQIRLETVYVSVVS